MKEAGEGSGWNEKEIRAAFSGIEFHVPLSRIMERAKRRRFRRRMAWGAIPAAALLAAGGAALLTADELIPNGVLCFDHPSLDEGGQYPAGNTGQSPREVCGELWAKGYIPGSGEIPDLQVCVFPEGGMRGAVGVFPSSNRQLCSELGLQPLPGGYDVHVKRFVEMRNEMLAQLREAAAAGIERKEDACLDAGAAREVVRHVLVKHGFDDWTVEVAQSDQPGACEGDVELFSDVKKAMIFSTDPGITFIHVF